MRRTRPGASSADEDARFGGEEETGVGNVDAHGGHAQLGSDVAFDAPPGAVAKGAQIGITRKGEESVQKLDAGMINVTAPPRRRSTASPRRARSSRPPSPSPFRTTPRSCRMG